MSAMDGLIPACCASNDFVLATGNTRHFDTTDLELINPWEPARAMISATIDGKPASR